MSEIKIVEYNESFAQKVADMWNDSADGWGGGDTIKTGDEVARSEASSENTNLYLALEGELVVGYCGLSEYKFDEDTMYIPLLNVRPTHHGKKIGKKLLLTALNRVVEMGWPRLDLFTWAGNTKAVPLYKKCGFFWEEMDQSTHLMNFIPAVLQTEAIRDYFDKIDWYDDSTRSIEVKPDGFKENKFEYYEYAWEKDSSKLRVQFERKGRGIRLIETDHYLIAATVEKFNLVFGRQYKVDYKIVNKTDAPLDIEIEGLKVKNVDNTFKKIQSIEHELCICNHFSVGEVNEEQNDFKAHPTVSAKIKINGKEAIFQVGISPEFPAKLQFRGNKELCYLNKKSQFYLDIENKFDEPAKFCLQIPSDNLVKIDPEIIEIDLKANERKSITLNYSLKEFGYFKPNLKVRVLLETGEVIKYTKEVGYPFKGLNAKFFGESKDYWELYNDKYVLAIEKGDNWQIPTRNKSDGQMSAFMPPKLGKPFYDEFAKIAPQNFEFYSEDGIATLEYIFKSEKKKGIELKTIHQLHQNGILATKYKVFNNGEETLEDIHLASPILHNIGRGVLPLKSGIVELQDSVGAGYSYWNSEDIAENWIFAKSIDIPRGLCWSDQFDAEYREWYVNLTLDLGKIHPKSSVITEPIYISVGAFDKWQDFRAFALGCEEISNPHTTDSVSLEVNNGNPIAGDNLKIKVKELKTPYLDGEVTVKIGEDVQRQEVKQEYKLKEVTFNLQPSKPIDYVKANVDLATLEINRQRVVFKKGLGVVKTDLLEEQGHKVYSADNGTIKIKAAPSFAANLFSLEYGGKEWLDSSFPQLTAKSWWSPWQGGLFSRPNGLNVRSVAKEEITADFVEVKDKFKNNWSGIKVTVNVTKHEKFKGLTYHQYFVMLPNVPVLCLFTEVEQNTGTYLDIQWAGSGFYKADVDINSCFLKYKDASNQWIKIKAGKGAFDGSPYSTVSVESTKQKSLIHFVSDIHNKEHTISVNKEVVFLNDYESIALRNGKKLRTQPNFIVLAEERIEENALKDLLNLRF